MDRLFFVLLLYTGLRGIRKSLTICDEIRGGHAAIGAHPFVCDHAFNVCAFVAALICTSTCLAKLLMPRSSAGSDELYTALALFGAVILCSVRWAMVKNELYEQGREFDVKLYHKQLVGFVPSILSSLSFLCKATSTFRRVAPVIAFATLFSEVFSSIRPSSRPANEYTKASNSARITSLLLMSLLVFPSERRGFELNLVLLAAAASLGNFVSSFEVLLCETAFVFVFSVVLRWISDPELSTVHIAWQMCVSVMLGATCLLY